MSTENQTVIWKLKILNTQYKGVEVDLSATQLLGSNEHKADLVIDDTGVQAEHVNILTSEQGVTLEAIDSQLRIHVNGQLWDESQSLPTLTPIHIGDLVIMIAEQDMQWPKSIPNFDKPQPAQNPKKETAKEEAQNSPSSIFKYLTLSALTISLLVFFAYTQSHETSNQKTLPILSFEETRELIQADKYPHLLVDWNANQQQLALSGYVEKNSDRSSLLERVEKLNLTYTSEIRTMDEIKAATRFILKNMELATSDIKSGETAGSLIFVTESSNLTGWNRAERILQRDIPGLTSWKLEVPEEKPALEQLKELLDDSSFGNKLVIEDKGERINLIGQLSGPEAREFKVLKQTYMEKFGANPYLVLTAPEVSTEESPNLNLNIRAVRLGQVPYFILGNGQKYFKGARLPNGERVASIESNGIYLTNSQETYIVYFDSKS